MAKHEVGCGEPREQVLNLSEDENGTLQLLEIPEWKWKSISMDFVMGLPRTSAGYDAIWAIVDKLTKYVHFIPIRANYPLEKLAQLYI